MTTTIDWLVHQSTITGIQYLAGVPGGYHSITGINIMDNPDTVPWLKEGQLILSTGYLFTSTDICTNIIEELSHKGCAGLGIKMNRYLDELPASMVTQANRLSFPIISIPFHNTMEEIANLVYKNIFSEEMTNTLQTATMYQKILEASQRKHNLLPMLSHLSDYLHCPVFLTNKDFEIIEYRNPDDFDSAFPLDQNSITLFPSDSIVHLRSVFSENPAPLKEYCIHKNNTSYTFCIFPILFNKVSEGFLIVLKNNVPFTSSHYTLIQNVIPIFHIALLRHSTFSHHMLSNHYQFYQSVLGGKLMNEVEIEATCLQNGFDYTSYRVCITMEVENYKELTIAKRRFFERNFFNSIAEFLKKQHLSYTNFVYDDTLGLFLFFEDFENQPDTASQVADFILPLCSFLEQEGYSMYVGISQCYKDASTIQKCYLQALNALELGKKLHDSNKVFSYHQDRIFHFLSENIANSKLYEFYMDILAPLTTSESKKHSELYETLYTFLENNLNVTQTAKALYIHRNTMQYRIEQIESLLGIDVRDPDTAFMLRIAFSIGKLLHI